VSGMLQGVSRPYLGMQTSSFTDYLTSHAPELLPGSSQPGSIPELAHGTTIVAAVCDRGVVMAGDRRATMGPMIAKRDVDKVFRSDEYSAIAYSGVASMGLEIVRLFQVELEHYEKMEGRSLSLEGKANRLASMIRGNLAAAMQGLAVIPLFVGYDEDAGVGRIFSYDVAGGPSEEQRFFSVGSGSIFARGSLKKLYKDNMPVRDAVYACVQALYDAADDDSATGGPDLTRKIYPTIATVTIEGFHRLPDSEAAEVAENVVRERMSAPDGPSAPLSSAE
jgi:proteasome beta subunit